MGSKVYYSKPLNFFWHHLYGTQKKITPNFTDDQIFVLLRQNILTAPIRAFETQDSRQVIISGLELWREDSRGQLLHIFFLDRQLRDFLVETPLSDLDGIRAFLDDKGQIRNVFHLYSNTQSENVVFRFALHLPYESDGYAFSLTLEKNGGVELYFSHGENGGTMSDRFYSDVNKKSDEISLIQSKMFRLALNTIAYMNCFPDCVLDGVPHNLFERSEDILARNFTVQVSEKVKEIGGSQLSKMPHFRKGHFKVLRSDYFVNKKGQIVFIAETMVKGKAKTVSTSPNLNELKSRSSNNKS